jgi:single-stranded-DNA-specific exonuclease
MSIQKRWKEKLLPPAEQTTRLASELSIDSILSTLLLQRGINTFDEAKTFFRPSLAHMHNPFLMKDMDKAVARIEQAIGNKESILIYGDYDVDGTTAVALVYSFFKNYAHRIDYYIPDRYKEGYGISITGIDFAAKNGYSLIIALDCGIKANDKIDYANKLGVDFIICDHHRPGEFLPNAVAVLDPKREDCSYPFDELSGAGVGFKLIEAFARNNNLFGDNLEKQIAEYLDFVVVSIAADIVPITGENRILAHFGLIQLNQRKRQGFKAIMDLSNIKRELGISDIVFSIAPRINAAGRIDSGNKAVELLISPTQNEAFLNGNGIDSTNTERKTIDTHITAQAFAMIEESEFLQTSKSTVLFNNEWHKGVVGIVASRLTEKYYRPTVVLTEADGIASGSARSVKDFDVYNAIESCSDLLEQFGGHMYAAGLTMKEENVQAFIERFEEVVATTIEDRMLIREVEMDAELNLMDITPKFFNVLKQFAPFGPGNMSPIFKSTSVRDNGRGKVVGNNHLKLSLVQHDDYQLTIDGIAFQLGHHHNQVEQKDVFDIVYHIEENNYNNRTTLQLNIKDLKFVKSDVMAKV